MHKLMLYLKQMPDETLIKTIDNQVETLTKSIQNDDPLRLRDKRVAPDDGYENYLTIAEAQVLGAIKKNKMDAIDALKRLKMHVVAEAIDR